MVMGERNGSAGGGISVFLCHASDDKPAVRNLYYRLRKNGIRPWLDEEDLLPGQDWKKEISKAVRDSDVVLVCLSNRAITRSGYVHREIAEALDAAYEKPEGVVFVIPAKLEPCSVPERLQQWQWVSLYEDDGYSKLLASLRSIGPAHGPRTADEELWETLLGADTEISIYTGSVPNADLRRGMIGDWDLRSASLLTTHLIRRGYRPTVEPAVYPPEIPTLPESEPLDYVATLVDALHLPTKNCLILGSADVNPLTELFLGRLYGVKDSELFRSTDSAGQSNTVVFYKTAYASSTTTGAYGRVERYFCRQPAAQHEARTWSRAVGWWNANQRESIHYDPTEKLGASHLDARRIFGHLVVARNPFTRDEDPFRFAIILNGLGGPATLGMALVLTGGRDMGGRDLDFVAYPRDFDPEMESENILRKITASVAASNFRGLQCIVGIGATRVRKTGPYSSIAYDNRRILGWTLDSSTFAGSEGIQML